jgi:penicillin G amidase
MPAWDEKSAWGDLVPFEKMPNIFNPPENYFATANNRPKHRDSEALLTVDWLEPYRHRRITERLNAKADWDLASIAELQQDKLSLPWLGMKSAVIAALSQSSDPALQGLSELLKSWDGILTGKSVEATLVMLFQCEMVQRLMKQKVPGSFEWAMGKGLHEALGPHNWMNYRRAGWLIELLRTQPGGWLNRSWDAEIQDVFLKVVRRFPQGVPEWGEFRPLTFIHPLGVVPGLSQIFNRGPIPFGGDTHTVTQAGLDLMKPEANPTSVAGMRAVMDVGAWENTRFVVAGGQSGNPFSPHYDDQLELWKAGKSIGIWKGRDELLRQSRPCWKITSSST